MNGWYLVPFPHCYCRFDSICNKQKKKGQAEALRFFSLGDLSLQSMKHGRQRRERKYRGTDTGREVWYSETKAPIKCRKKIWDRWSQETNRQTDRQRKKKMGSSVTWRKGWAAVGRGTTATGVTHFFLLFTPVAVLAHCVSVFFFFTATNQICQILTVTLFLISHVKLWLIWGKLWGKLRLYIIECAGRWICALVQ